MSDVVFLWKHDKASSSFSFMSWHELPQMGFRSMYGIPRSEADKFLERGSYEGYSGVCYDSPYLVIDCDEDGNVDEVASILREKGLSFDVYTTGNRGAHFYVKRVVLSSPLLYLVEKSWVATNFPELVDIKLYSPLHLIRQPGHYHEKTGKRKELLTSYPGNTLDLLDINVQPCKRQAFTGTFTPVFDDPRIMSLSVPHYDGVRHEMFPKLAKLIALTGNPKDFALQWLINVNSMGDPLDESKLVKMVDWAYRTLKHD